MFYVIHGGATANGSAEKTETKTEATAKAAAPKAQPTDWSNIAFAAQYCLAARAEHEDRLAG